MKSSHLHALRRLTDRVLEAPDLTSLSELLTHELPRWLEVPDVSFLIWNRKLDTFEGVVPGRRRLQRVEEGGDQGSRRGRYLISDGALIPPPGPEVGGTLLPLMARSGLVGMLVLGQPEPARLPPFQSREVRLLTQLAHRVALAVENNLFQREIVESERIAALGTMAGMLAHDFRGPMTVIRGYAESFLDADIAPAEIHARAEIIMQMVDRLDRMATETLDFARGGGQIVRRPVEVAPILGAIADGLERELTGIEIVRRFALPRPCTGWFDVDKLQRAIGNIAANSRDAMKGAGRFHMAARVEETSVDPEQSPATSLVLVLADEGPGVPEDLRSRIFEPFVTHGKKRGTGLGLVVSRRFIEDHGGRIELLPPREAPLPDRPNGARFKIVLPLAPPVQSSDDSGQ